LAKTRNIGHLEFFLGIIRETTIFGATLLFDEIFASFKWLFGSFLATYNGRQPRTIVF
jgi:zinc finger SWIM domain-containing protein 3